MGALVAFRPAEAAPPLPHNDNVPAWQGYVYAPHQPDNGLVMRVFVMRFWRGPVRAAAAGLARWGILR